MNRNRIDYFSNLPQPTMHRTKQDFGVHRRLTTVQHGLLTPFYCRMVYPHSTIKHDMTSFIRMDNSINLPLDDVYLDTYYFFVPFRILDENFEKIMGFKPTYDAQTYFFPTLKLDWSSRFTASSRSIINHLGYGAYTDVDAALAPSGISAATPHLKFVTGTFDEYEHDTTYPADEINAYIPAAYYLLYNQYFRDENVDPEIPIEDLVSQGSHSLVNLSVTNPLWNGFNCLPVNRYHDFFSNGLISPANTPDGSGQVYIPLGTGIAPVITGANHPTNIGTDPIKFSKLDGTVAPDGKGWLYSGQFYSDAQAGVPTGMQPLAPSNLIADLSNNRTSVNQLYLALAMNELGDRRATYGTRLVEQIRGSFGLTVPDGLLNRAEYLGGSNQTLNNLPVYDNSTNLGAFRGVSHTLTGVNSWEKSFNEWGLVIGVCCTRVKHTYSQGVVNHAMKIFDNMDMYWPEFAMIGKVGYEKYRLWNNIAAGSNNDVFNYNEAYLDEHTEIDFCSGLFGSFKSPSANLALYWTYQDLYFVIPQFSSQWLKEDPSNVRRTLTGQLIPGATNKDGNQYMIDFHYRTQLTMPIPVRSHAPSLTGWK